jgi:hypothetical protein
VISIAEVTAGGTAVDPASYALNVDAGGRASIVFDSGISDPVSVTFRAGYPNTADNPPTSMVPDAIKVAILLFVGAWYENRETTAIGVSVAALPSSVATDALLAPYRWIGI